MKKKAIVSSLILIISLVLIVSCSESTSSKIPSWIANKTWAGEVTTTVGEISQTSSMVIVFDDNGIVGGAPEGAEIIYASKKDSLIVTEKYSSKQEGVTAKAEVNMTFTRISGNECKVEGKGKTTVAGISTEMSLKGTLKAQSK